ncbi:DUF302 domain-containing protein [Thermodesulfobacteriota bacterium]
MSYYLATELSTSYADAVERTRAALAEEGFGVLTEIDVKATLKKKIDVDFRDYCILGACNPPFAHRALQAESNIGLLLPCNVVVQERGPGIVEVAAIDPVVAMQVVGKPELAPLAEEVRSKLQSVIESL